MGAGGDVPRRRQRQAWMRAGRHVRLGVSSSRRYRTSLRIRQGIHMSTAIAPAVIPGQRRYQLVGPPTVVMLLVLMLASVLVGCGASSHANSTASAGSGRLARLYTQTLSWSSCAGIFQCSALTVPLDYANPGARTIQLAVIRARATDPAHRIGSLITNPGGPGGSGVQFVEQSYPAPPGQPSHFGAQLRADFDIVGFDPRGVGRSAPITCLSDTQLDHYFALDPTPHTPAQVDSVVAGDKTFDAGCQARSAMLLPYVGTRLRDPPRLPTGHRRDHRGTKTSGLPRLDPGPPINHRHRPDAR